MPDGSVRYEVDGGIATITLDRPESKNMFTAEVGDEVWDAFSAAHDDDDVRVIVLTGNGSVFCGGIDPSVIGSAEARDRVASSPFFQEFPSAVYACPKATLCSIGGHAMGVGVTMTLGFDVRIVADDVRLTMPFLRLGIIPGFGGTWLLPRLLGRSKTLEILYSGRPVLGAEAARIGLATVAVPRDEVAAATREMAATVAALEAPVPAFCKRAIDENEDLDLPAAIRHELALFDELQVARARAADR